MEAHRIPGIGVTRKRWRWDEDFEAPVRETLYHVIGHELQHRGELDALLWQMDVEPPITDFLFDSLPAPKWGLRRPRTSPAFGNPPLVPGFGFLKTRIP